MLAGLSFSSGPCIAQRVLLVWRPVSKQGCYDTWKGREYPAAGYRMFSGTSYRSFHLYLHVVLVLIVSLCLSLHHKSQEAAMPLLSIADIKAQATTIPAFFNQALLHGPFKPSHNFLFMPFLYLFKYTHFFPASDA